MLLNIDVFTDDDVDPRRTIPLLLLRCADQKSRSGVEQQLEPGHNRGYDLPADDTQLQAWVYKSKSNS
jgi:hypothetical protein